MLSLKRYNTYVDKSIVYGYNHFIGTYVFISRYINLSSQIEASCTKFDHRGKGYLSVDEIFNVVKLQNGVDVSKDEVKGT